MFLLFIFQVVFYSSYCLDIYVCSENYIKVRDAAISLFNQGKAMEEIQPIPFIKNFLLRYVDEAALQRRQSQAAEDDNPPSPTMVGGMSPLSTVSLSTVPGLVLFSNSTKQYGFPGFVQFFSNFVGIFIIFQHFTIVYW